AAVRAEGEVLARTVRHFTVLQPLSVGDRAFGEEQISALTLNFFGKDIKLFKKSGKSTEKYAIIKRKEQVVLFGEIALPIFVLREYRLPYTEELLTLTEEEAVRAAHLRIRGAMAAALTDAELLRKSFSGEWTDEGYLLTCTVECISDIAAPLTYETE
ncbi:MAG: sporulation protein YqfD, partial [Clostridia bacterium]|nr:sporulation protein YqfD [Clostridia bacterium]